MEEPKYDIILKDKIDYYGETRAAYEFAANEFAIQSVNYVNYISGDSKDFSKDLFKLINAYCKQGLKKPDLVDVMKYVTKSCEMS